MENSHVRSSAEVLRHFSVSEHRGLSDEQVRISTEKYGRNGKHPSS
jgi:hypothetical protein